MRGERHDKPSLIGQTFGRLRVQSEGERTIDRRQTWSCVCSCGGRKVATTTDLRRGFVQSCGCLATESKSRFRPTHGHTMGRRSSEYQIWTNMITRCTNKSANNYSDYGGRGITVCDQWRASFERFLADVGPRPTRNHSLDRYPNGNGNYEPRNVRWATKSEQQRNRRTNRLLTYGSVTATIAEWSERTGLSKHAIKHRLNAGWPVDLTLTKTSRSRRKR